MQISVDVHNYMETLVGHVLAEDSYIEKYDNEQLADLACLALSQLRPVISASTSIFYPLYQRKI